MPRLRSQEIVEAMTDAMLRANQAREKRLAREKSERKERRHRKKDKKKKKRDDSSSSDTSSSSSGSALIRKMQGHDDQPFRQAAKHHPGVIFADAVAKSRQGVHQVNHELQVSRDGPVFRSWLDTCFRPRCGSRIGSHKDELEVLIIVLDEIMAGRFVEAADVLASRMRMLSVGIETNNWRSAQDFLVYRQRDPALVTADVLDVAHAAAEKTEKRRQRAARVNSGAGR